MITWDIQLVSKTLTYPVETDQPFTTGACQAMFELTSFTKLWLKRTTVSWHSRIPMSTFTWRGGNTANIMQCNTTAPQSMASLLPSKHLWQGQTKVMLTEHYQALSVAGRVHTVSYYFSSDFFVHCKLLFKGDYNKHQPWCYSTLSHTSHLDHFTTPQGYKCFILIPDQSLFLSIFYMEETMSLISCPGL